MLKIISVIAVILAIVIAIVLILALTKPDSFRVQRATTIRAPAENIFPLINDFQQWRSWSPYENKDPAMKRTYGGAERGKGAVYAWDGNRNVGAGRMEILNATSPSNVVIKLDFIKPFEAHNMAEFTLEPKGDTTLVTWAIYGPSAYVTKVMGLFFNMDTMIGKDFETGLADLKTTAEKQ